MNSSQKAPDGAQDEDVVSEDVSGRISSEPARKCGSSLTNLAIVTVCRNITPRPGRTYDIFAGLPNPSNKYEIFHTFFKISNSVHVITHDV